MTWRSGLARIPAMASAAASKRNIDLPARERLAIRLDTGPALTDAPVVGRGLAVTGGQRRRAVYANGGMGWSAADAL
ncbi:hypothetical protein ABR759_02150 [Escherichia coli]